MSGSNDRSFNFEAAPELPGADRLSKYAFGGIRRLTHRLWDFTIEGRDNVPLEGPAIITPNHLSFCDSVFVPAALPRRVWAIGKGEYMDSWKTKHLFPAMGMIPVDRSGGDAAQAALDTAARVLEGGRLFMIYPGGHALSERVPPQGPHRRGSPRDSLQRSHRSCWARRNARRPAA